MQLNQITSYGIDTINVKLGTHFGELVSKSFPLLKNLKDIHLNRDESLFTSILYTKRGADDDIVAVYKLCGVSSKYTLQLQSMNNTDYYKNANIQGIEFPLDTIPKVISVKEQETNSNLYKITDNSFNDISKQIIQRVSNKLIADISVILKNTKLSDAEKVSLIAKSL